MAHVEGHKRGCKCAICGRGRKASKGGAKKSAAAKRGSAPKKHLTFLQGFHDGKSDRRSGKPLRKTHGKTEYARGYREGVRLSNGAH